MACATLVVSSSYTLCPLTFERFSRPSFPLMCILPGSALPLYVLAANNFRLLLASKSKKILFIPDFHVLCICGSLSFLQQHKCSNRGSLAPFTRPTRSPPPQNRKRNVVAFCKLVLAGVMLQLDSCVQNRLVTVLSLMDHMNVVYKTGQK